MINLASCKFWRPNWTTHSFSAPKWSCARALVSNLHANQLSWLEKQQNLALTLSSRHWALRAGAQAKCRFKLGAETKLGQAGGRAHDEVCEIKSTPGARNSILV